MLRAKNNSASQVRAAPFGRGVSVTYLCHFPKLHISSSKLPSPNPSKLYCLIDFSEHLVTEASSSLSARDDVGSRRLSLPPTNIATTARTTATIATATRRTRTAMVVHKSAHKGQPKKRKKHQNRLPCPDMASPAPWSQRLERWTQT